MTSPAQLKVAHQTSDSNSTPTNVKLTVLGSLALFITPLVLGLIGTFVPGSMPDGFMNNFKWIAPITIPVGGIITGLFMFALYKHNEKPSI